MMRKTESVIVFVQQLGRGLRKAQGKEYLIEGLSTINFELVAKKRILKQLRGKKNLFTLEIKKDYQELKRRLNKAPLIADFIKNNMVASQAILSILNKKGKLVNTPIVSYDLKLDTPISLTRYRMLTEGSNE